MKDEYTRIAKQKFIDTFHGKDTTMEHELFLLTDSLDRPLMYFSDIQTPVCIDNICKPLFIKIYWNLLGSYVGFDAIEDQPMTKYDHDLFEREDKLVFHRLLQDRHSVLERRSLSALFDPSKEPEKQIEYKGQKVDGISGATRKEISKSVVPGALFSCYTAWHLANGEVISKMKTNLQTILSPSLLDYLLQSKYEDYQYFALRHLDSAAIRTAFTRIAKIYTSANALTKSYILKKLPPSVWSVQQSASQVFNLYQVSDVNARSLLIGKLEQSHPVGYDILAHHVKTMTRNQLLAYLSSLRSHADVSESTRSHLENASQNPECTYSYLIDDFLKE